VMLIYFYWYCLAIN